MLGEGLRAGLGHLGIETRAVCYVEREAHAAGVLAARIEEGSLDPAPVWSDMLTFDARAWRGAVDCVAAGFPCQDLSLAGRRAGLDGARSGLFFSVLDIADASGAWLLVLENVAGIASATASVVDEASASDYAAKPSGDGFSDVGIEDGRLLERAAARVVGELADLGWDAEWITLSASDVGASHGRARWFCIAWRMAHPGGDGGDGPYRESRSRRRVRAAGDPVEQSPRLGRQERRPKSEGQQGRPDVALDGSAVADASPAGWRCAQGCDEPGERCMEEQGVSRCGQCGCDAVGRPEVLSGALADAERGRDRREEHATDHRQQEGDGPSDWLGGYRGPPLFAPGPADQAWAGILAEHPELAPALEPTFRCVVDGLAFSMGDSRAARLKCVGNGVVALQAGVALVELVRRARGASPMTANFAHEAQIYLRVA